MSAKKPTHYEILGVKEECTPQEIRSAFLNLSKVHHPDLHANDPSKHHKYVRIMEAYTVLSKPSLRSSYDDNLRYWVNQPPPRQSYEDPSRYQSWRDETIWEMRNKDQDPFYNGRPYYGVPGVKRVSNLWIAGGAVWLMAVGAFGMFVAIKKSSNFTVSQLDRRDIRLATEWNGSRNRAERNGNDVQLGILASKLAKDKD